MNQKILVAGATGDLGTRIVKALLNKGIKVLAVVRLGSDINKIDALKKIGADVYQVNNWNLAELIKACDGVNCVVSSLAGLREVIIDAQKVLLDAAIAAGVPRFIPSDYSLDFTRFSYGENRNLDLRREFHEYLDSKPIASTSIFNGAFAELLTSEMPVIFFKPKLVLYWGDGDTRWNFTTKNDTALYTANAAVEQFTPRYLRIAGDHISPREMKDVVNNVTGKKFRLLRTGGQGLLGTIIKITRKIVAGENDLYPAWQGMQYMHNMIDPRSQTESLDNDRYPEMKWTTVSDVLTEYVCPAGASAS
jgi:nucleoside-diphosphate-sugar epimerase